MWKMLFCMGFISFGLQAGTLELQKESRTIYIEEKPQWNLKRDLFGMPFIYFSPEQNGQRSNISFTDTGADVEFDSKALDKTQNIYQDTKKKWASKVGAIPETFLPYEMNINKHGHKVHKIGFEYKHDGKVYAEKSFYIECRGKVLFSKSLRLKENSSHDKDFNDLLNTLDCGGV